MSIIEEKKKMASRFAVNGILTFPNFAKIMGKSRTQARRYLFEYYNGEVVKPPFKNGQIELRLQDVLDFIDTFFVLD